MKDELPDFKKAGTCKGIVTSVNKLAPIKESTPIELANSTIELAERYLKVIGHASKEDRARAGDLLAIKARQLANTVIDMQGPTGQGILEIQRIEKIRQEQREKDAEICFNKANEYVVPCKDISDRHGGKVVAANTCGHAILSQGD